MSKFDLAFARQAAVDVLDKRLFPVFGKGLAEQLKLACDIIEEGPTGTQIANARLLRNYAIGAKVICRSNNDEPLTIGTITAFENIKGRFFPVVTPVGSTEEFLIMGIMHPYSEEKEVALNKLTPKEQWNVMAEFYIRS